MHQLKMIVDNRERNFQILDGLAQQGVEMAFAQLPVGDYIISDRICVERKTVSDFESSIIDARVFDQVKRLHESFLKPVLLVEGSFADSRLGTNVLLGAVMKLYVDYNTQVIMSADEEETAYILSRFAEHEQNEEKREPRLLGIKKAYTDEQWQILILSSIPGIGSKLARKLISHFKTVRGVASASVEQLTEVEKIGTKKAHRIYSILNAEFDGN